MNIKMLGEIVKYDEREEIPLLDDTLLRGGLRVVETKEELDATSKNVLKKGSIAIVSSSLELYWYDGDNWNQTIRISDFVKIYFTLMGINDFVPNKHYREGDIVAAGQSFYYFSKSYNENTLDTNNKSVKHLDFINIIDEIVNNYNSLSGSNLADIEEYTPGVTLNKGDIFKVNKSIFGVYNDDTVLPEDFDQNDYFPVNLSQIFKDIISKRANNESDVLVNRSIVSKDHATGLEDVLFRRFGSRNSFILGNSNKELIIDSRSVPKIPIKRGTTRISSQTFGESIVGELELNSNESICFVESEEDVALESIILSLDEKRSKNVENTFIKIFKFKEGIPNDNRGQLIEISDRATEEVDSEGDHFLIYKLNSEVIISEGDKVALYFGTVDKENTSIFTSGYKIEIPEVQLKFVPRYMSNASLLSFSDIYTRDQPYVGSYDKKFSIHSNYILTKSVTENNSTNIPVYETENVLETNRVKYQFEYKNDKDLIVETISLSISDAISDLRVKITSGNGGINYSGIVKKTVDSKISYISIKKPFLLKKNEDVFIEIDSDSDFSIKGEEIFGETKIAMSLNGLIVSEELIVTWTTDYGDERSLLKIKHCHLFESELMKEQDYVVKLLDGNIGSKDIVNIKTFNSDGSGEAITEVVVDTPGTGSSVDVDASVVGEANKKLLFHAELNEPTLINDVNVLFNSSEGNITSDAVFDLEIRYENGNVVKYDDSVSWHSSIGMTPFGVPGLVLENEDKHVKVKEIFVYLVGGSFKTHGDSFKMTGVGLGIIKPIMIK